MDIARDASIAILGASVALGGLLLIFCGFLFAQAASFPKDATPDELIDRYRNAGRYGVYPFVFSLLIAGLRLGQLLWPSYCMFVICCVMFLALLLWTALYGALISWRYL
jgi:hypothetical protein